MSHARMKTVFLHSSNYLPWSIFLIAATVGKPGFRGISTFLVNQVISYWPSYGSEVCCIGPRPKAVGQYSRSRTLTGPIRNYLINDIFFSLT